MKYILLFLLLYNLASLGKATACGNSYEKQTRPDGSSILLYEDEGRTQVAARYGYGFDTTALLSQKEALLRRIQQDSSYQALSDLALIELKIGNPIKGVQLLEKLYQQHAKEYAIVANLGTAYELIGKNELAYRFIKRALELKPDAHWGSEWIHLKILEQKLTPSPDYTAILQLGTGKSLGAYFATLSPEQVQAFYPVKQQLLFQLEERLAFVAPQDPIVGQLLFDLADLVAITESVERAKPIWELAFAYDPGLTLVNTRLEEANEAAYTNPLVQFWPWMLGGILMAAGIYYLLHRSGSAKRTEQREIPTPPSVVK